jgi:hypothetical protein
LTWTIKFNEEGAYPFNDIYAARGQHWEKTYKQHKESEKRVAGENRENAFLVVPTQFNITFMCSQGHLAAFNNPKNVWKCTICIFFRLFLLFLAVCYREMYQSVSGNPA